MMDDLDHEMFVMKRDYSWLDHPDLAQRLFHGRTLLRDAVQAVLADACEVDWSSPRSLYHGLMIRRKSARTRILVNPTPVMEHQGEQTVLLALTLHGVALHEASHALFTSLRWMSVLRLRRCRWEALVGYVLPENLVWICANLTEDIWIEDRLTDRSMFPGFRIYFQAMRLHLFSDTVCAERTETLARLWNTYCADPASFCQREELTAACVDMVITLMNRPDSDALRIPEGLNQIGEATEVLRAAGQKVRVSARHDGAVIAADQIYRLVRTWRSESTHPSESAGADTPRPSCAGAENGPEDIDHEELDPGQDISHEEQAEAETVERAFKRCRIRMREDSSPRGRSRTKEIISRKLVDAIKVLEREALDREEKEKEAEEQSKVRLGKSITAVSLVVPERLKDVDGRALIDCKTVRIVISSPETLYQADSFALDIIAAHLLRRHQAQAKAMRGKFARLLQNETESIVYGQRTGEPDDTALADLATGGQEVFIQRHVQTAIRLDLTLLLDESGSMETIDNPSDLARWELSATAAILLEYALRPYFAGGAVRLAVYGFTSDAFQSGETVLYHHFDSSVRHLNRPIALGWCYAKCNNADGIALAALRREIQRIRHPDREPAVLMVSDGQPYAVDYEGRQSCLHVHQEVEEMVRSGIRFAHLQIGTTEEQILNEMYGDRWKRVERSEDIPAQVADLAMRWLTDPRY